ncbi:MULTISPECIES: hypothetical protein [unclassified Streptomyces]|uniref:hypothetical protein n=1 Tax=unclassified Streptomyces TaxID=2593676 RepID=UPI0036F7963E
MTTRRPLVPAVSLTLVSLLVTGCGGASAPPAAQEPEPDRTAAGASGAERGDEWERRAVEAVDAVAAEDVGYAEAGAGPVARGVRVRVVPLEGEAHTVFVACAGAGAVKVVIGGAAPSAVPCDATAVHHRVPSAPAQLPIQVTAVGGATGAIAWRIESVALDDGTTGSASPGPAADPHEDDDDTGHPAGRPGRKVRR